MMARATWSLLAQRRNPGWRAARATIRAVDALDADAFAAWQDEAVAAHVRWAVATIPYWRARSAPDARLEDLPILRRADVQQHAEDLRDPTRPEASLEPDASGGSTGEPVRLWHDRAYWTRVLASEYQVLEAWGLRPWHRTAVLWGSDVDIRALPWRERLFNRLQQRHIFNAFHLGDDDLDRCADALRALQAPYLQGYASALHLLARRLEARGIAGGFGIRVIRSSAEVLEDDARACIERAFDAPVRNYYGSRESACLAFECAAGGFHVMGHGRRIEIVDDAGAPCAPGTPGRVLVTDITNRAFGLLRYETGDVAAWASPAPCACGLPYPRLARVHGRTSDFITTPDGERIHGEWFTHLFYGRAGVERFLVEQPARDRLQLRTVGAAGPDDLSDLLAQIRARLGTEVDVTWERVERIDDTRSGKRRFTVSHVPYLPGEVGP